MSCLCGPDRSEVQLLPPCLDDYVAANAPARFIVAYAEGLDFTALGVTHAQPKDTGRPPYHPADLLKLYLYGYLHRVRSSRHLEAEAARDLEGVWLLRGVRPDFKTLADFRRDNRAAFMPLFKNFNLLRRSLDLFGAELVAIDGSKFKAPNHARRHCTREQLGELLGKIEARIEEYLSELDGQDAEASRACPMHSRCTTAQWRVIARRPNEEVVGRAAARVAARPEIVSERKTIVEHVFGTMRQWGHDSFLMRGLAKVRAEFSLGALICNLRRMPNLGSVEELLAGLRQPAAN